MKFILILILPLTLMGQNWSEPVNISTMNGVNQNPDLFIDNSGILHCVWAHRIEVNYSLIYYSTSIDDGQNWSIPVNISQNFNKWLLNPKVVVDSGNNIYVSYDYNLEDPIHSKILLKIFDGLSWSLADTISGNMLNCSKNKLVIDNNDRLYCFWNQAVEGGDYYYRYFENGIWSDYFHPYGDNFSFINIVVDSENSLHVLAGHFDFAWYFDYVKYSSETDIWSDITVISDITSANGQDLDIDNYNHPHFAWRHKTPGLPNPLEEDSTLYRFFNGIEWSEPELVTEDPAGHKIQIVNGKPYIIDWEKAEGDGGNLVFYQKDNLNNWIGEIITYVEGGPEVLKKSENKLHFIYKAKPYEDNLNIYYTNRLVDTITSVSSKKFSIKKWDIFPNPFTTFTNVEFELNKPGYTTLKVYSYQGKIVRTLIEGTKQEGKYNCCWDGKDNNGVKMSTGVYLLRLQVDRNILARSIIIK